MSYEEKMRKREEKYFEELAKQDAKELAEFHINIIKKAHQRELFKLPKVGLTRFNMYLMYKLELTKKLIFIGTDGEDSYCYITYEGWRYLPKDCLDILVNKYDLFNHTMKLKELKKQYLSEEWKNHNIYLVGEANDMLKMQLPVRIKKQVEEDKSKGKEFYEKRYLDSIIRSINTEKELCKQKN